MAVNFYKILQNVCLLAHEELPASFVDSNEPYPEIKRYIQNIVEDVCSKYNWTFREKKYTFSTVNGQYEYDLPNNLEARNIIENGVRVSGQTNPLYFIDHQRYDALREGITGKARPERYSIYQNKLLLDSTPDGVYSVSIKYYTNKFATDSTGDTEKANLDLETDITLIPDRYTKVIEWGAFALFRQNFKTDNKYMAAKKTYEEYLRNMRADDGYGNDAPETLQIANGLTLNSFINQTGSNTKILDNYIK